MHGRVVVAEHSKSSDKRYTKKAIAEYAKQRGLTYAQASLYEGMLLHGTTLAYEATSNRYYHIGNDGSIDRHWRLHTTTARGIIDADVLNATADGELIRYDLRPDAHPQT